MRVSCFGLTLEGDKGLHHLRMLLQQQQHIGDKIDARRQNNRRVGDGRWLMSRGRKDTANIDSSSKWPDNDRCLKLKNKTPKIEEGRPNC